MQTVLKAGFGAPAPGVTGPTAMAQERPGTILGRDAPGSMWGQISGVNRIAIARGVVTGILVDAEAGASGSHSRIADAAGSMLRAPSEPRLQGVRPQMDASGRVLASAPVEMLAADAPMDEGAGLSVPASSRPGEVITATSSGGADSDDQRGTLARADQADFSGIGAEGAVGRDSMAITLPDSPGRHEIRFINRGDRQVLGRSILEVQS